ncbi:MAG: hypothetical protein ACREJQ_07325 [bacterium]
MKPQADIEGFAQTEEVRRPTRAELESMRNRLKRYPPPGRLRVEQDAAGRPVIIHTWERGAPYAAMRPEQLARLLDTGGVPAVLFCLLHQRAEWMSAMDRLSAEKWVEETRGEAVRAGARENAKAIERRVESAVEAALPRIYKSRAS